jgi:hypothetical protein
MDKKKDTQAGSPKALPGKSGKDEKKKKQFDNFSYYLAWGSFVSGLLAAFITLAKRSETPKRNDHYK